MIEAQNIIKSFGTPAQTVLHDLSFTIESGDFVTLTGRSGSGKSTLLYIISTLDKPTSGVVRFDGQDINRLSSKALHDFRNQHIGFVFQFHYLLPELSALENIMMPAKKTHRENNVRDYAIFLLEHFEIADKKDHLPRELSGGQCQRVAIARALIMKPRYLFADEPTGNLDSTSGERVMQILHDINQQQNTTVVYVTHDTDFAQRARRQIVLIDGKLENQAP